MRDLHCHILPGVDDGARNLDESLAMLEAAKAAGITSIVCTPHVRDPYFDYDAMWDAYELLVAHADGFPLTMGFEVNHSKLMQLGMEWAEHLHFDGTNEFLLELSTRAGKPDFEIYERTIFELQGMGYQVIIAHPERYRAIQEDVEVARGLVKMGCKLQASADFIAGGRMGAERKPAKRLFDEKVGKLGAAYICKSGIVFNFGRIIYLSAEVFFFKYQHAFTGTKSVYRRREPRRSGSHHYNISHFHQPFRKNFFNQLFLKIRHFKITPGRLIRHGV